MARTAPPKPEPQKNLNQSKRFQHYQRQEESEQHDIIKQKLTGLNWVLADKALTAAHSATETEYGKLVQLCTALGISYDKAFGKREITVKPLSFPPPLIQMVRKGLCLANAPVSARVMEASDRREGAEGVDEETEVPDRASDGAEASVEPIALTAPKPPHDPVAYERQRYLVSDKPARLARATELRHQRQAARKQMLAAARMKIASEIPWQQTIPIDKGVI